MPDDEELRKLVLSLVVEVQGLRLDVRSLRRSLEERGVVLDPLHTVADGIETPEDVSALLNVLRRKRP